MTLTTVARLYRFRGRHHLPQLTGTEYGEVHEHDYTVEVVAESSAPLGLDTAALDALWAALEPPRDRVGISEMDDAYGAENTSVESLAEAWLVAFREFPVVRVTVWEDDKRWASASP